MFIGHSRELTNIAGQHSYTHTHTHTEKYVLFLGKLFVQGRSEASANRLQIYARGGNRETGSPSVDYLENQALPASKRMSLFHSQASATPEVRDSLR